MKIVRIIVTAAAVFAPLHAVADAGEPVTLENLVKPEPNRPDEPRGFSILPHWIGKRHAAA